MTHRRVAARSGDLLCLALAALNQVEIAQLDPNAPALTRIAQLSMWALLLARHVSVVPVLAVPVVPVILGLFEPGAGSLTQLVAIDLAAYWAARHGGLRVQLGAAVLVVASVVGVELQQWPLDRTDITDIVYVSAPGLLAVLVARRVSERHAERAELHVLQQRLAAELAARAEQVLAEERERIGRELHDVVAQGAGAVVAQATAARLLLATGRHDEARRALVAVEDTTRDALADMRRLMGVLRTPLAPPPQPGESSLEQALQSRETASK